MIFSKIYQVILTWAEKKSAIYYLAGLSFLESFLLPYPPPDFLLAPMALKQKIRGYYFAFIGTIFSVFGGIVGYLIGYFAYEFIAPYLDRVGYADELNILKIWFDKYGIWIIFLAGFSPVPYKLFTIMAGFLTMLFLPFVIISLFARGARFFLIVFFIKKIGDACDVWLRTHIDRLGYTLILLIFIIYILF